MSLLRLFAYGVLFGLAGACLGLITQVCLSLGLMGCTPSIDDVLVQSGLGFFLAFWAAVLIRC